MDFLNQFERFAPAVSALPHDFAYANPLPSSLRMTSGGAYEIYYAPFDHVASSARIVLVGITPGRVQAIEAIKTARDLLQAGVGTAQICAKAKAAASFAGPMRSNLVQLLDFVGTADRLRLQTTAELWTTRTDLVHFTSALRYPVFEAGKNFSGSGVTRQPLLIEQLNRYFATECEGLSTALFVPLGAAAEAACDYMIGNNKLRNRQVLRGLPHPSGANAERIAYFLGRKDRALLSSKTRPELLDAGRENARRLVAAWA